MGMFGNLMNKIFRAGANAEAPDDALKPGQPMESRVEAARRQGVPVAQATPGVGLPEHPATGSAITQPGTTAGAQVDVEQILNGMAAKNPEKLDWKHSIVDLMKLVGMDSSIAARKELAEDLHYTGDMGDSAKMNMWLHKEVMKKLAENGGKVPADLLTQ